MHHIPFEQRNREVVYIMEPQPKPRASGFAIAGFTLSLLGFFTCFVLSPLGLLFSLLGLFRKPRGLATAGTIMGLIGTSVIGGTLLLASMEGNQYQEAHVREFTSGKTEKSLLEAKHEIEKWRLEHDGYLPDGIEGNKLVLSIEDAWRTSLSYEPDESGYTIRSAGPDRDFDTEDDVTSRVGLRGYEQVLYTDDEFSDSQEQANTDEEAKD